jgi:hypothetical protein
MEPIDVRRFIAEYTPADERFIRFDWNGKPPDEFEDRNLKFREAVFEAVLDNLEDAPILLVRDLYRAETEFSSEAWCISGDVGRLAEHLLRRGDDQFIEDFLEGKFQSFDAHLGTGFPVDLPLAEHLLGVVRSRLQSETDAEGLELLRSGEELFKDWVTFAESNRS